MYWGQPRRGWARPGCWPWPCSVGPAEDARPWKRGSGLGVLPGKLPLSSRVPWGAAQGTDPGGRCWGQSWGGHRGDRSKGGGSLRVPPVPSSANVHVRSPSSRVTHGCVTHGVLAGVVAARISQTQREEPWGQDRKLCHRAGTCPLPAAVCVEWQRRCGI